MSRPKRERKTVNYTEEPEVGISTEKDSDDEYVADPSVRAESYYNSHDELPLKSLVKKAAKKMNQSTEKKIETHRDIKINSNSSFANICRPNLSEGEESSESDEDDEERSRVKQPSETSKVVIQPQPIASISNGSEVGLEAKESEEERLSQSPPTSPLTNFTQLVDRGGELFRPDLTDVDTSVEGLNDKTEKDIQSDSGNIEQESAEVENSLNGTVPTKVLPLAAKLLLLKQKRASSMKEEEEKSVTMVSSGSEDLEVTKVVKVKKKKRRKKEEKDKEKDVDRKKDESMDLSDVSMKKESKPMIGKQKESPQLEGKVKDGKSSDDRKRKSLNDSKTKEQKKKRKDTIVNDDGICLKDMKATGKGKKKEKGGDGQVTAKQTLSQKLSVQKQNLIEEAEEALDESDSSDNWEEVDEVKTKTKSKRKGKSKKSAKEEDVMLGGKEGSVGPIKDLEVSVQVKNIHAKKTKCSKEEKLYTWARQMFHRIQKNTQIQLHKTHLLCLFARAIQQNNCCNNKTIAALCLSLVPSMYLDRAALKWDINFLRKFIQWFQKDVPAVPDLILYMDKASKLMEKLKFERVLVFVTILRALGFTCRAVFSLQPVLGKLKKADLKDLGEEKSATSSAKKTGSSSKSSKTSTDSKSDEKAGSSKKSESETPRKKGTSEKKSKRKSEPGSGNLPVDVHDSCNTWTEVYLNTLKRWICVELRTETINEPSKCEASATQPLQYVIGIDNNDRVKDITCRYAEKWLTINRKLRVDREWWAQTLEPYQPPDDAVNSAEDGQMSSELMRKDMPTTISAFKNHPLYVLQRHLLKYEAIYPEGTVPVGYIGKNTNKEPVYPRDCVHTCHTQQTWMKEGRSLIAGEQPYKMVKGRKKLNERHLDGPEPVQSCYGIWQTEQYRPPPVIDGKITKNEYGNIELFQPWMLPEGAVHIPLEKVHLIARKLDIDYAQAMMGWDHHGGFNHPIFEGIVVAKENEDKVYDAWNRAEEEREAKEKKKREERVYTNWKKLVKGLMIRASLSEKYTFEAEEEVKTKDKAKKLPGGFCTTDDMEEEVKEEVLEVKDDEEDYGERTNASAYWRPLNKQDGVFDPATA